MSNDIIKEFLKGINWENICNSYKRWSVNILNIQRTFKIEKNKAIKK